jgi:hypothetical protein
MSGQKEIKASVPQLKRAFQSHGRIAENGDGLSEDLLRFYANECGLKALFLTKHQLIDTGELEGLVGRKYGHGHDLIRWVDELKLPKFTIKYSQDPDDPIRQAHEKLRYGVDITPRSKSLLKAIYTALKDKKIRW